MIWQYTKKQYIQIHKNASKSLYISHSKEKIKLVRKREQKYIAIKDTSKSV